MSTINSGHLEAFMAGKKGQKKRFWANEEKRSICEQALAPGVSVAQVARRNSMNANLIFKWLKEDVTQELEYIPGRFVIREIVRPRIACNCC